MGAIHSRRVLTTGPADRRAARVPRAAGIPATATLGASTSTGVDFTLEFAGGFEIAAPPFAWSVGFVEMLRAMRRPTPKEDDDAFGDVAIPWQLWCGRFAMGAMAFLALAF